MTLLDLLILVSLLTAFGTGVYLLGHSRGRQEGWNDARSYRGDESDRAGA